MGETILCLLFNLKAGGGTGAGRLVLLPFGTVIEVSTVKYVVGRSKRARINSDYILYYVKYNYYLLVLVWTKASNRVRHLC